MAGVVGDDLSSTVSIIPEAQYPFKILEATTQKKNNVQLDLKEVRKDDRTEYRLTVVNLKEMKGRYNDMIILKTDSKIKPELRISVYGNLFDRKQQKKVN
ncbi:hypothetical protein DENIS_3810 [Desulfonema ishimotonii]|uniref:Uncharacterized protein n=2 Tax=Desulfonema ishimotonii TaxID=45657 RepID=A0A401G0V7_9BACT|nr:hypothetical protein DENIS_3810 [Desulfonema ishimotonii]